ITSVHPRFERCKTTLSECLSELRRPQRDSPGVGVEWMKPMLGTIHELPELEGVQARPCCRAHESGASTGNRRGQHQFMAHADDLSSVEVLSETENAATSAHMLREAEQSRGAKASDWSSIDVRFECMSCILDQGNPEVLALGADVKHAIGEAI